MVIGVTPQEVAISAMVNWRASYIRWALPMRLAVISGLGYEPFSVLDRLQQGGVPGPPWPRRPGRGRVASGRV